MGDFNDSNQGPQQNYWRRFKPFKYSSLSFLNGIVVKSHQPPNTCCTGHSIRSPGSNTDHHQGDYILISDKLSYLSNPHINTLSSDPSSDHLAVESAIICITSGTAALGVEDSSATASSAGKLKYLKYKKKYLELRNN
jgi:endonuclease/exonuclease/phosphatase family metal-dependent hydrolase